MRRDPSQAGNRARKTCHRCRRGEHAGELGSGLPEVLLAWDSHTKFSTLGSPHRGASPRESFLVVKLNDRYTDNVWVWIWDLFPPGFLTNT